MSSPHTPSSKQKLERRNLEIAILHKYYPEWSNAESVRKTENSRETCHDVVINAWIDSIPTRLEAVYKANSDHTKW
jgi:hypothetical protein